MITTLTGKNQVTVPAKLVQELHLHTGVKLDWFIGPGNILCARRLASKRELSANLAGRGRRFMTPGADPIAALVAERAREDE